MFQISSGYIIEAAEWKSIIETLMRLLPVMTKTATEKIRSSACSGSINRAFSQCDCQDKKASLTWSRILIHFYDHRRVRYNWIQINRQDGKTISQYPLSVAIHVTTSAQTNTMANSSLLTFIAHSKLRAPLSLPFGHNARSLHAKLVYLLLLYNDFFKYYVTTTN